MKAVVATVVLTCALTACGGGQPPTGPEPATPTPSAPISRPAPVVTDLAVRITGPEPDFLSIRAVSDAQSPSDTDRPVLAQVVQDLERETLLRGRVTADLDGRCDGDRVVLRAGAETRCTVDYAGVTVPWRVVIAESYRPRDRLIRYSVAIGEVTVLQPKAVYGRWWEWVQTLNRDVSPTELRLSCEEIPPVRLVPVGRETEHRCQWVDPSRPERLRVRTYAVATDGDGNVSFRENFP